MITEQELQAIEGRLKRAVPESMGKEREDLDCLISEVRSLIHQVIAANSWAWMHKEQKNELLEAIWKAELSADDTLALVKLEDLPYWLQKKKEENADFEREERDRKPPPPEQSEKIDRLLAVSPCPPGLVKLKPRPFAVNDKPDPETETSQSKLQQAIALLRDEMKRLDQRPGDAISCATIIEKLRRILEAIADPAEEKTGGTK